VDLSIDIFPALYLGLRRMVDCSGNSEKTVHSLVSVAFRIEGSLEIEESGFLLNVVQACSIPTNCDISNKSVFLVVLP
jgi:hypothetical protein